ncbi:MAG TPA: hypothetical protein VNX65_03665 [Patescibacteria group bacterium]|nr:hypothetical protein [Patescibacteria group bacterium]
MQLTETHREVITASIDPWEVDAFRELTSDLVPRLGEMTEVDFLDEMQNRAPEARNQLPEIADFLGLLATHTAAKVAIVSFPESTTFGVRPTPAEHLKPGEQNLFAPDIYRGMLIGMADWYGYGYTTQQASAIHNNIVQVKQLEEVAGHSAAAPHELGLHVEDASYNLGEGRDISPDFLTLHYFRNPSLVPTLVSVPDWDHISTSTRDRLSRSPNPEHLVSRF